MEGKEAGFEGEGGVGVVGGEEAAAVERGVVVRGFGGRAGEEARKGGVGVLHVHPAAGAEGERGRGVAGVLVVAAAAEGGEGREGMGGCGWRLGAGGGEGTEDGEERRVLAGFRGW